MVNCTHRIAIKKCVCELQCHVERAEWRNTRLECSILVAVGIRGRQTSSRRRDEGQLGDETDDGGLLGRESDVRETLTTQRRRVGCVGDTGLFSRCEVGPRLSHGR